MLMSKLRSLRAALFLVLVIVAPAAFPQSRERVRSGPGTGDPYESLVPWRFLEKGGPLVNAPLVLYWFPATSQEAEKSPLLTSRELIQATDRCLTFEIVVPEDPVTIQKFGETGKLPAAVLADAKGTVIRRVEGSGGRLTAPSVEKMVRDELNVRGETMYARITEAKKRVASGDKEGAIDLYKKLWDERCLFPLAGSEAQHALKDLGVIVVEPPPQFAIDPNLPIPATTTAKPKSKPPDGH
jgi:hypothetical protein